jgi:TonB family protein
MSLRLVDKLVREENYAKALRVLIRVREQYPENPYLPAYEERLRALVDAGKSRSEPPPSRLTVHDRLEALAKSPVQYDLPPVESQLNAVASPPPPPSSSPRPTNGTSNAKQEEQKRIALLSKIASLIGQANAYLARDEYDEALEETARAKLLDPDNKEIHELEKEIRRAKEEAHKREQERLRLAQEQEEAEQVRRLEEERERVRLEEEETRSRREEARRFAQQQKMNLCLRRSREFMESGLLAEAQSELAFALVIEPGNREATEIEKEIARKHEEIRQAEIERKRKEEEERRQEQERLQATIRRAIVEAEKASTEADFAQALTIITRAYVLDPANKDLMMAESGILAARDEWAQKQQEERLAREEEARRKREEELRRKEEEERERLLAERLAEAEAKRKEDEAQIAKHLSKAESLTEEGNYDQALAEVALAFVINPFSEQVKEVERQVLLAQGAARASRVEEPKSVADPVADTLPEISPEPPADSAPDRGEKQASPPAPEAPTPEDDVSKMLVSHLEKAHVYSSRGDYAQAFDQIAKAYALSPLDRRIAECESSIQALFVEHQEAEQFPQESDEENHIDSSRSASGTAAPDSAASRTQRRAGGPDVRAAGKPSGRKKRSRKPNRFAAALLTSIAIVLLSSIYITNSGNKGQPPEEGSSQQTGAVETETQGEPELASLTRDVTPEDELPPLREGVNRDVELATLTPSAPVDWRSNAPQPDQNPEMQAESQRKLQTSEPGLTFDDNQPSAGEAEGIATSGPGKPEVPINLDPLATVRPPEIVRLVKPSLADIALKSEIEEEVSVMVEIGADGQPLQAKILQSSNALYNHAVIDAVMKSEYSPGQSHAGPITMWMTIPFHFKP